MARSHDQFHGLVPWSNPNEPGVSFFALRRARGLPHACIDFRLWYAGQLAKGNIRHSREYQLEFHRFPCCTGLELCLRTPNEVKG